MSTIISVALGSAVQFSTNVVDVVVRGLTSKSSTESILFVYTLSPNISEMKMKMLKREAYLAIVKRVDQDRGLVWPWGILSLLQ
jgi:hypothetical protein